MFRSLRILLVSEDLTRCAQLQPVFTEVGIDVCACSQTSDPMLRSVVKHEANMLVVVANSVSQDLMHQLHSLYQQYPIPIVIFTENDELGLITFAIKAGVSAYVVNGLAPQRILPILEVALVRFEETQAMLKKLQHSEAKLEERKTIDKAKGIIMKNRGISEDQAYQSLRKLAMDKNQRIFQVAQDVISLSKLIL